ncbi:recombinase family protein [Ferruginibacter sp. HRS2-29]|uniref:recombinase family protein n=1 Tax=Ferruginibacter sp. HRS2-29 TaxID=2487334 RepID=UPI0020CCBC75|nr:recombinase family protein [Ferruginibacter sp. HRS2-29]MCP9750005.1 recombinase family protein [Ferruginibacter sp. HRS2-29]
MKKAVAYYRVSTARQGQSGLGLEAQEEAVHFFKKSRHIKLVKEFIEIESSKRKRRPVLQEALEYCAANGTLLVIAKLDRLARNVAFISALMESNVEFVAADNPEANRLILHILAAFAEYEREQISIRTKAALQAAKKRGVVLGANGRKLAVANSKASCLFVDNIRPLIASLIKEGYLTIQSLTDELNRREIKTFREGARWHKSTVFRVVKRL